MSGVKQYTDEGKTCAKCKQFLPLSAFPLAASKRHPWSYCRPCRNLDARTRRAADPERYKRWDRKTPEYQRQRRIAGRDEAYDAYGGECVCCGETEYLFLTIDHVNNDGKEHRAKHAGRPMYTLAKLEGYPDSYQLLCYNCNCGRHRNGGLICPHTT